VTLPLSYSRHLSAIPDKNANCETKKQAISNNSAIIPETLSKILELMTGIEPVTSPLPRECSTN
jgi:hypothetical protein